MHTQQLAKELLYSLPMPVHFAGFTSTTTGLAKAGWDLSMKQQRNDFRGGLEMQLAIRHGNRDFALYALSHPVQLDYGEEHKFMTDPMAYAKFFTTYGFEIAHIANDIQFRVIPTMSGRSLSSQFAPIDAMPSERESTWTSESIKDFKFFKTVKPNIKDLIVSPDQVPELLDLVLKTQKATQAEIRERMASRRNYDAYKSGEMFKPAHTVEAQIITLAV